MNTVTNDGLDALDDDALGARFAVEVVGWKSHDHPECMKRKKKFLMPEKWAMTPDGQLAFNHDMYVFATSVDALLAIAEQWKWYGRRLRVTQMLHGWLAVVMHPAGRCAATCGTLPRAICIAMLRANKEHAIEIARKVR